MEAGKRKTGILGGTFDPIHYGHLLLGETAYEQLGLDRVLFMPAGMPPHKLHRTGASDEHRVSMVRLAISGNPHFELCLLEIGSGEYSYTCRTLEKLKACYPKDEFYFIAGQDSLEHFDEWKDPGRICELAYVAVSCRPGCSFDAMDGLLFEKRKKYGDRFFKVTCPGLEISSRELRKEAALGRSLRYRTPDAVSEYILEQGLYRQDEKPNEHTAEAACRKINGGAF